ncbi:HAD-IA family hydrolase [Xinfangfangia sp. CPCC 101601]|uniref:phosphoglycolate phosphatase n=1 Tax=Pseudogemmobacter lacusdianii TaxID=3069608 RepID=A0ABU0VY46_9RHOB|nr:HAD-IA family hydrolase [Xinfangfangia sp. CPCC 101601]MDQ2066684.1 HAD-IA family hydrolase [Xinfangfangia sp. CPCC 101601]
MLQASSCVVFDLDGTLADTSGDLLAAANSCFRAMGVGDQLGPEDAQEALNGGRAMLRRGLGRLGPVDEEVVNRWYQPLLTAYADAICVHTVLYPGVVAALETLRSEGRALAVCTNKPEGLAETLLRALHVRDYFGALVGADTLPVRKPDAAPYHLAVRQAGDAPRSMLLGDTETDYRTARAAGVPIALVTFGHEGAGVSRLQPDALLEHFEQLPELARQLLDQR